MLAFVPAIPSHVGAALSSLKERLGHRYGSAFGELRLFGSYARGEQHDQSDIDVLVLFEREGWDDDALYREVAEVDVEFKVWISVMPMTRARYQRMLDKELGIAQAIEEEGITV